MTQVDSEVQAVTVAASQPDREAPSPAPRQATLWRNADFLKFWFGESVSLLGMQVTTLALPYAAIKVLDATPQEAGLLRFLQLAPYLAFGLLFGVWVDRVRRRPVMLGANVARMLLVGSVPVLAFIGQLNLTALLVAAFGIGVASVLFDLSWSSYLPTLVKDPRHIVEANSKLGTTATAADTAGPALGGVLVSVFTAPIAMAVDAFSYLASLIALLLVRTREPRPERAARPHLLAELREGLRWVFGNRYLRAIAFVGSSFNFVLMATMTLFMLYALNEKGVGGFLLGAIWSVASVGGFLGALFSDRLVRKVRLGVVYAVSVSTGFVPLLLIPLADGPTPLVVAMFMAAFFLCYLGVSVCNVIIVSLRQVITPQDLLGRMTGAMRTLLFGGGSLGGLVAGWLGATLGLRPALWVVTIAAALAVVPVVLSPVTRLRSMPTPVSVADLRAPRRPRPRRRAGARHRRPGPDGVFPRRRERRAV